MKAEKCENLSQKNTKKWSMKMNYVEPVVILTMLANSVNSTITTNMVELQYCKAVLQIYDEVLCLDKQAPYFSEIQKYTSTFAMYETIILSIFPAVISIFLGSWSDTFGRRPLILSGVSGYILSNLVLTWMSSTNTHPDYFLLSDLPEALTGGTILLNLSFACYICDITTEEKRAFRLGILLACNYFGALIGTLAAPYLRNISYSFATFSGVVWVTITFLYILFFLEESVATTEAQRRLVSKNPFQWSQVQSIITSCFVTQSSHTIRILFCVGLLTIISAIQIQGHTTIFYLFLQNVFGWTVEDFSRLTTVGLVTTAMSTAIASNRVLNLSDVQILNLIALLRLLSSVMYIFVQTTWLVYLSSVIDGVAGLFATFLKSFLSKTVNSDDVGKIFSLCGILDLSGPLFGTSIYNMVYNETMETYPRAVFLVSTSLCSVIILLMITLTIMKLSKKDSPSLPDEENQSNPNKSDVQNYPDKEKITSENMENTAFAKTGQQQNSASDANIKKIAAEVANVMSKSTVEHETQTGDSPME